jgi:phage shock protein A
MFKALKRWWKYLGAKVSSAFNEKADPKIQLEQAIQEAQEQHRRLKEQAANVIANQKTTEMQLNQKMEELEKLNANARQAVLMADDAAKSGNQSKATEYTQAAEAFANRLIALEHEVENLKQLSLQSAQASDQAKAAVTQNSTVLQKKLAEKQRLLSQLDQAKMQEQLNTTMASLSETVGQDVPTLAEVQQKIEQRYAKATAAAELEGTGVEAKMLEVETAAMNTEAQARLEQIRSQLGLAGETASEAAPAVQAESAPAAQAEPAPAPQSSPAPQPEPAAQPQTAPAEPPA